MPLSAVTPWQPLIPPPAATHACAHALTVQITPETLVASDPDYILVAPCGFDSERAAADAQNLWQHEWWRGLRAVRDDQVWAMDGNAYYAR
jgi:ABC-type Fe3+-hydroxamate transport system substrate-binding protein